MWLLAVMYGEVSVILGPDGKPRTFPMPEETKCLAAEMPWGVRLQIQMDIPSEVFTLERGPKEVATLLLKSMMREMQKMREKEVPEEDKEEARKEHEDLQDEMLKDHE